MSAPRGDLEDLWCDVDVRFTTYAPRALPKTGASTSSLDALAAVGAPTAQTPFDPLRCADLEAELSDKRPEQPKNPKQSRGPKDPKDPKDPKGQSAAAPASVLAGRRRRLRLVPTQVTVQCKGDVAAERQVDGLMILGRADVAKKRLLKPHGGDAPICTGGEIDAVMAEQMRRSLDYSKRINRPRIICNSVAKYRLAAR